MKYAAVDLFCGIGGLTHGVQETGINVIAGIDIDSTCQYAYEKNNNSKFINRGIEEIEGQDINALYPKDCIKILMGCAPCQPFSNYSLRYIKDGRKDNKWKLLYYFLNLIKATKPHIVSMENVPQLTKEVVFKDFISELEKQGYKVSWSIVHCADYGVPQNRNRLVLLASRLGYISITPPLYNEKNYITVADAIGGLEPLKDGDISKYDMLHRTSKLSKMNKKRIKQSVPGGTWRDWNQDLILPCHKKNSGKGYIAVYGRMEWEKPSPTVTTQFYGYGNGRFGHPEQDRALSLREGAILQSFPIDYKFIDADNTQTNKQIGIHIGNAVPVKLGVAIGLSIKEHIKKLKLGGELDV
ncbi:DNA cytosine methyltransferase [Clostridium estertheticum]|uniref:DNA cytosine methyltransferase n=1 Tax=Clostridium estertheticum TaxID=238834 RepID=UPI001C6F14AB|nr:DNA cytosine methyltransferase [Clostridium estertheticum]MBW9173422.1 DNA cytosine methyltransferase [Clostridium estertheticum]WLC76575.1 DNA cytosine methyltransferase [Clostridium estertheticum]